MSQYVRLAFSCFASKKCCDVDLKEEGPNVLDRVAPNPNPSTCHTCTKILIGLVWEYNDSESPSITLSCWNLFKIKQLQTKQFNSQVQ